jgi:hypothetical protein
MTYMSLYSNQEFDVLPLSSDYYGSVINDNNLIVFGSEGAILYSNNQGASWDKKLVDTNSIISGCYFKDNYYLLTQESIIILNNSFNIINKINNSISAFKILSTNSNIYLASKERLYELNNDKVSNIDITLANNFTTENIVSTTKEILFSVSDTLYSINDNKKIQKIYLPLYLNCFNCTNFTLRVFNNELYILTGIEVYKYNTNKQIGKFVSSNIYCLDDKVYSLRYNKSQFLLEKPATISANNLYAYNLNLYENGNELKM